jgi:hypothetical protein
MPALVGRGPLAPCSVRHLKKAKGWVAADETAGLAVANPALPAVQNACLADRLIRRQTLHAAGHLVVVKRRQSEPAIARACRICAS